MYRITIVEDDHLIRDELKQFLEKYDFECTVIDEFKDIVNEVLSGQPDVILLDINLPVYDGYHICRELRKTSDTPIMILTSRASDMDELMGINMGADDFITKPFNPQILLARIEAIIKRTYVLNKSDCLVFNGLKLDSSQSRAYYLDESVELTKNENRILKTLMENKNRIVGRDEIMQVLWQTDEFVDDNTLTVNINRLRTKLKSIGATDFIKTMRGQGYILK